MPTSLSVHKDKLAIRLQTLDSGFNRHLTTAPKLRTLDRAAIREGLISALWQAWCQFFRSVILTSASGGTTESGNVIVSGFGGLAEAEILYVAKLLSNRARIGTIRPIAGPHLEPTWGDIAKALNISAGMRLSNSSQLLSALSVASSVPDLQICRNATAHMGISQLTGLKATRVRYVETKMKHPTDACTWIDPNTDGYLWDSWVEEIRTIAYFACL